jgi:hypothetical protein
MYIIIKGSTKFGRTRSEQEQNLRREGMRSLSDEQLDKCKYMEKHIAEQLGSKDNYVRQDELGGTSGIKSE